MGTSHHDISMVNSDQLSKQVAIIPMTKKNPSIPRNETNMQEFVDGDLMSSRLTVFVSPFSGGGGGGGLTLMLGSIIKPSKSTERDKNSEKKQLTLSLSGTRTLAIYSIRKETTSMQGTLRYATQQYIYTPPGGTATTHHQVAPVAQHYQSFLMIGLK